jgi:hypothetical protein
VVKDEGQGAKYLIAIEDSHAHVISYDNKAPHWNGGSLGFFYISFYLNDISYIITSY